MAATLIPGDFEVGATDEKEHALFISLDLDYLHNVIYFKPIVSISLHMNSILLHILTVFSLSVPL